MLGWERCLERCLSLCLGRRCLVFYVHVSARQGQEGRVQFSALDGILVS